MDSVQLLVAVVYGPPGINNPDPPASNNRRRDGITHGRSGLRSLMA